MQTNPAYRALSGRSTAARRIVLLVAALALAVPALAQGTAHESFLAVQRQVEAVQPKVVKSTVGLRIGGRGFGASGSGVIISTDGYVLTAAHVVGSRPNRPCAVILSDGRQLTGTILGSDTEDDYAVVKITEPENLTAAPLGDSATLRGGQWVLSTGHPLGIKDGRPPVLRIGRVMSMPGGRQGRTVRRVFTDAPLISGDSGGPLFDLNGRVVGINSMITQGERRMASIHVPVNLPKAVLAQLEKGEAATFEDGEDSPFARALRRAQAALRNEDAAAALTAANEAGRLDPTSAVAKLLAARAYARSRQPREALSAIDQACERGFNDVAYLKREPDFASLGANPGLQRIVDRLEALDGLPGFRKGDPSLLAVAYNAAPNLDRGVVRVVSGETEVALGTVMSPDGDILTKASELPQGPLSCALPDGRTLRAERLATDSTWDVALLKVRASGLKVLPFSEGVSTGRWTFSPDAKGAVAAVGVVGVTDMPVPNKGIAPKPTSKAYMGVVLAPVEPAVLRTLGITKGVRAMTVEPDMPADRAGIQTGDVLIEADGQAMGDPDEMMDYLVGKKPGDTVKLRIVRGEERLTLGVNLVTRPAHLPGRGGLAEFLSGEVSRMAGPFTHVLQHDSILNPRAMGGPLLDADGKLIGLNIARADRTSTYAIPAKDLLEIYTRLKAK
jgi:S1-C subfamily serine protease